MARISAVLLTVLFTVLVAGSLAMLPSTAQACAEQDQCVEKKQINVGIAVGLGARSNPVEGGSTIPQVVLLDLAWYGDYAYFDNGELGIRFIDTQDYGFESYLTFDRERAFFSFWDPANIIVNTGSIGTDGASDGVNDGADDEDNDKEPSQQINVDNIATRKWAALLGGRFNYYQDSHKYSIAVETDLSGVHNGQRILVSYQKSWFGEDWRFSVRPSLAWKSNNLIDYYYGLSERDNVDTSDFYEGKGGFQPGISFLYTRKLSEDWQLISSASYVRLNGGMTDSPLVKHKQVVSVFVGAGYRF